MAGRALYVVFASKPRSCGKPQWGKESTTFSDKWDGSQANYEYLDEMWGTHKQNDVTIAPSLVKPLGLGRHIGQPRITTFPAKPING